MEKENERGDTCLDAFKLFEPSSTLNHLEDGLIVETTFVNMTLLIFMWKNCSKTQFRLFYLIQSGTVCLCYSEKKCCDFSSVYTM